MEIIKGVLKEELANSLAMQQNYQKRLEQLPKGALIKKKIKGSDYYYLVYRKDGKVHFDYKGKSLDEKEIKKYHEAKVYRAKYRKLISELKKQIKFLRRALRGSQAI
jgi:hypothetical protein